MKKLTSSFIIFCITVTYSMFALGQMTTPQGKSIVIPDGTEISAVTTDTISSKTAQEDDPITFKVDEDVVVDGSVVIAKGAILKGVVTNAKKSGFFGKGGQLNIRVESTETVDKQKIKVRAAKGKEGDNKTGTTVALVVLFGPLGLLKKGKNAEIKEGTKVKVYTDETKTVVIPTP
jgi:two-component sensor histidine kinase